jgi:hypothetical protein
MGLLLFRLENESDVCVGMASSSGPMGLPSVFFGGKCEWKPIGEVASLRRWRHFLSLDARTRKWEEKKKKNEGGWWCGNI